MINQEQFEKKYKIYHDYIYTTLQDNVQSIILNNTSDIGDNYEEFVFNASLTVDMGLDLQVTDINKTITKVDSDTIEYIKNNKKNIEVRKDFFDTNGINLMEEVVNSSKTFILSDQRIVIRDTVEYKEQNKIKEFQFK